MKINWYEPKFGEREKELVNKVLDSGYVSEGPITKELEERFKRILGVKHVIFTTSGTASLYLALKAVEIIRGLEKDNYEVIVPDLTFVATANAVKMAGATPILVDIEEKRLCINIEDIERKITGRTKVIIPVHVLGRSCDMRKLKEIAEKYDLDIIEDGAGALFSKTEEEYLGTLGKIGCFSLQGNKIISCGQGGIVVTNDDKYNEIIRRIKDQGRLSKDEVVYPIEGHNFKFNDILAAIILGQLEEMEFRKMNLINQRKQYEKELSNIEEISFPEIKYDFGEIPLWVDIIMKGKDKLAEELLKDEIVVRKCWPPVHRNNSYKDLDENFPVSSSISDSSLWLPNGPMIDSEKISYICGKIKEKMRMNKNQMQKIYSKINPAVLLHIINRKEEINEARTNIAPDNEYLQLASLKLQKGQTFKPHKHITQIKTTDIAQESWIVVQGKVKAILYDLDDKIIEEVVLNQGDCSITFRGGHNYEALEENTLVYEYKTGPYLGQEKDKAFILQS